MGILMTLTGFALWKPDDLGWMALPFGGEDGAKAVHFWLTILFVAYFVIHVTQVARAGWGNFRSMVTGYEVVPVGAAPADAAVGRIVSAGAVLAAPDEPPLPSTGPEPDPQAEGQMRQMSRRSFLYGGIAALVGLGLWGWLARQSGDEGVPPFLRGLVTGHNEREKGDKDKHQDPDAKGPAQDHLPDQKDPDQK